MRAPTLIVVFGAAVRADGRPSGALAGRIALARRLALEEPGAIVFCSGAVGREGPSEASVIADGLRDMVAGERLVLDETSRDTLQTALAAARYARANGIARCIACTDNWHQPRARMLLRMFGVVAGGAWMTPRAQPAALRARNYAREALALPYDVVAGAWALTGARVRRAAR
ncbi:YdcF family protein [Sphingomonas sp. HHU CXW]|uniref:YdcF family protein n=1 Tax=Sphingomonas hominis TaxID=2741495 RepID=A0ABX2JHZ7_9SPHN|nr:YdcF family protein [Sphingomonas hominis]NTS66022.1 YdcF family protein [Sphingomonas hominis]